MKRLKILTLVSVLIMVLGSVWPMTTVFGEEEPFPLRAEVTWNQEEEKFDPIEIEWDEMDDLTSEGYRLEQSSDGGKTWESRSMKYGKGINVLNVYPEKPDNGKYRGDYLKEWMEDSEIWGGSKQLITVDKMGLMAFQDAYEKLDVRATRNTPLLDQNGKYKYDVIMFGTVEDNNGKILSSEKAYEATNAFAESGRGILFGRDVLNLTRSHYYEDSSKNREKGSYNYFYEFRDRLDLPWFDYEDASPNSMIPRDYKYYGESVSLYQEGYLFNYPFQLNNSDTELLEIKDQEGNTVQKKGFQIWTNKVTDVVKPNKGTVWLQLNPGKASQELKRPLSGYGSDYVRAPYLYTAGNLGFISVGDGWFDDDYFPELKNKGYSIPVGEKRIIANTLYNLAQISLESKVIDGTATDKSEPKIGAMLLKDNNLNVYGDSPGTTYKYRVTANTKSGEKTSEEKEVLVSSGMKEYRYVINDSEEIPGDFGQTNGSTKFIKADDEGNIMIPEPFTSREQYIHIAPINFSNIVGGIETFSAKDIMDKMVKLTFMTNKPGESDSVYQTMEVSKDQEVELPPMTGRHVGYDFKGWSLSPNGPVETSSSSYQEDTVLYAIWEKRYEHTLSFDLERTGNDVSIMNFTMDVSKEIAYPIVDLILPKNMAVKGWDELEKTLLKDYNVRVFRNSDIGDKKSYSIAFTDKIPSSKEYKELIEKIPFVITDGKPEGTREYDPGKVELIFHERIYTSYYDKKNPFSENPEARDDRVHYYTFVPFEEGKPLTWFEAYNAAKKMEYKGLRGFLATMRNAEQHTFIYDNIAQNSGWIGATRLVKRVSDGKIKDEPFISEKIDNYRTEPVFANEWYWTSGPDAGKVFFDNHVKDKVTKVKKKYVHELDVGKSVTYDDLWNPEEVAYPSVSEFGREPNNAINDYDQGEYVAEFGYAEEGEDPSKYLNDLKADMPETRVKGYYVEFTEYGEQKEQEYDDDDVYSSADIPQNVYVSGKDILGEIVSLSDRRDGLHVFSDEFSLGKEVTYQPLSNDRVNYIQLSDGQSDRLTIGVQKQEITAVYNKNAQLVYQPNPPTLDDEVVGMPKETQWMRFDGDGKGEVTLSSAIPTTKDYVFKGWLVEGKDRPLPPKSMLQTEYKGKEKIELKALWGPETVMLTYAKNTSPKDKEEVVQEVEYETPLKLPNTDIFETKDHEGHRFLGWNTERKATKPDPNIKEGTPVVEAATYYAMWQELEREITYHGNHEDAKGKMGPQIIPYFKETELSSNSFERDNYVFVGWSEQKGGPVGFEDKEKVTYSKFKGKTDKIDLYAQWKKAEIKINEVPDFHFGKQSTQGKPQVVGLDKKAYKQEKSANIQADTDTLFNVSIENTGLKKWNIGLRMAPFVDDETLLPHSESMTLTLNKMTLIQQNTPKEALEGFNDVIVLQPGGDETRLVGEEDTMYKGEWQLHIPFNEVKLYLPRYVGYGAESNYTSKMTWSENNVE